MKILGFEMYEGEIGECCIFAAGWICLCFASEGF